MNWQCLFWFYFQWETAASKKLLNLFFSQRIGVKDAPQRSWNVYLFSYLLWRQRGFCFNIIPLLDIEMHVNMLSLSVFRLLSTSLPPQRLVSIISCRRRLVRGAGAGACSCVGLEHGLGGGNGGSVQSTLSWQKHQTLWHIGPLPGEEKIQHNWILRTSENTSRHCQNCKTRRWRYTWYCNSYWFTFMRVLETILRSE